MCVFICVCVCLWHYPDLPCCADHRACAVEISADWPDDFRFCARLTWTGIKSFGFAALADFPNIIGPRGSDWRWDRSCILRVTDVSLTMSAYAGSVLGPQCITGRCNYTVCQRISSVCSVKSRRWINIHCPAGSAHRPPGRSDGENQTRLRNVYGSSRGHFWAARSKQRRNRKHRLNSAAVFDPGGSARFDQSVSSPSSVRFTCCLPAGEARVLTSVTCPCCSVTGHGAGSVCL